MSQRWRLIISGILIALILCLTAATVYIDRMVKQRSQVTVKPQPRADLLPVPNQEKFTKYEYVLPRQPNTDTKESIYSPLAQIRGKVDKIDGTTVSLIIAGQKTPVAIPEQLRLYCVPETFTDADGRTTKGRDIYFDFSRNSSPGNEATRENILELLVSGRDVGMLVDVAPDSAMTATLVISYDCPK